MKTESSNNLDMLEESKLEKLADTAHNALKSYKNLLILIQIGLNSLLVKLKSEKNKTVSFQQCTYCFAPLAILLFDRINLCKTCIHFMLLCFWFQSV